jgi:hypothetical protein
MTLDLKRTAVDLDHFAGSDPSLEKNLFLRSGPRTSQMDGALRVYIFPRIGVYANYSRRRGAGGPAEYRYTWRALPFVDKLGN